MYYMSQYNEPEKADLECPYVSLLGTPDKGFNYVDKTYSVNGLNRFEVQDILVDSIYPEFRKRNISKQEVDVQFRLPQIREEESVELVVRRKVADNETEEVEKSSDVFDALKAGLKKGNRTITVQEGGKVTETGEIEPPARFPIVGIVGLSLIHI